MTSIPSTPIETDSEFDDEWHLIDWVNKIECRRMSDDTYQLRNPSHVTTVNQEGFNLYRTNLDDFETWLDDNSIVPVLRNTKEARDGKS